MRKFNPGHLYLDRLAALPQSHLTDLPRMSGGRRDHSFSYQAIYLHKEIFIGTAQEIFSVFLCLSGLVL